MSGQVVDEKFHDWELNHEHLLIVVHGYKEGLGARVFRAGAL